MKRHIGILAAGMAAFLAGSPALHAQTTTPTPAPALFGSTFFGSGLVTVDPATGAATNVGSFGSDALAYGIATRNGRIYTFDQVTNRVREISKVSGKFSRSIDIGVSGLKGEGDIAFRPSDNVGFLASALNANNQPVNDLYTFTISETADVGVATRLGSSGVAIDAMAFDSSNTLYAIGQADGMLYTINQTTGAATAVGPLGVNTNSPVSGMTFAPDGKLYAAIDDRLHIINKATGAATPVSSSVINFGPYISSVSGLTFAPGAGTLATMSGRLQVGTGERVSIVGFLVRGTPDKRIVVRGIGPSLAPYVSGFLANPVLELFDSQGVSLAKNDDFSSSPDKATITSLGLAPPNPKESAILRTLPAGNYTAVLSGVDGGTGIGLVEAYDVDPGSGSSLKNLSARGFVQSGDNLLIGGLNVMGSATQRVVVRAIGPDLTTYGITNPLADPVVFIFDGNGTLVKSNDNFASDPDAAEIAAQGLSPRKPLESATVANFAPGLYTAVVRGADNGSGVALVQSYNLTN
ncbi:MAG: DUF4394 domain-containing protein [Verrucomicrobiota bacterium]|nr:DUF4394 domain-containing protein [Verrucomicrobiota bacterium]